jgi:uncharacterized LabA/DUF88 family protein
MMQLGIRADYDKIHKHFEAIGDVVGNFYFTALPPQGVESSTRRLVDHLQYHGWTVVSKETRQFINDGKSITKGNIDVELTVQAWRICEYITDLVLFSGDGDFRSLAEELQNKAVRVTAVSLLANSASDLSGAMSDSLRRQVNEFIDLRDFAPRIAYEVKEGIRPVHGRKVS